MGSPGRKAVKALLPGLIREFGADLVVANAENIAHGFGVTADTAQALFEAGVDVLTTGNHSFDKKEAISLYDEWPNLLRPANHYPGVPGHGVWVGPAKNGEVCAVINLMGKVYMPPVDDPFRAVDAALARMPEVKVRVVDMHAEVTSEKQGMGWHLAGRVTAVFGSHSHVPTADARLLPASPGGPPGVSSGTAFITDVGMTGPYDSVIGMNTEIALSRFYTGLNHRLEVATEGVRLYAFFVECDAAGRALRCESICRTP